MGETVCWAQNCLRIFKLSKLVNGKGIHSGTKHLSHGPNLIEPQRGRVGKAKHICSSWAQKLNGK